MSLPRPVARARRMNVRRACAVAFLFLVTSLLAAPVQAQQSAADVDFASMRKIAVGDHWTYESRGQDEGTIHNEVVKLESRTNWKDNAYDSFRIHSTGDLRSTQETSAGISAEVDVSFVVDKWVRERDYATVHIDGETTIEQSFQNVKKTRVTESFDPPLVELVYPFADGYHWKSQTDWYNKRGSEDARETDLTYEVKVLGKETVRVPAGQFEAWKLRIDTARVSNSMSFQWYAPEVCDLVKEERYDGNSRLINTMLLTSYACAGAEVQERPAYDPAYVRLISRGVAAGTTDPGPDFHVGIESENAPAPGFVVLLSAVAVLGLVAVGRRRRS